MTLEHAPLHSGPTPRALASNSWSTARDTCSTVRGNRSPSSPMKMDVSSAVSLPRLKSRSARSSTLSSAACERGAAWHRGCGAGMALLRQCLRQAKAHQKAGGGHPEPPPDSSGAARFMLPATYSVVLMARSFQS